MNEEAAFVMIKGILIRFVCLHILSGGVLAGHVDTVEPVITIGRPPLYDILYSPDRRFLATLLNLYADGYIELLDAETYTPMKRIHGVAGEELVFSPDSALIAVLGRRSGIQVWSVDDHRLLYTIPATTRAAVFSPDGKYLAYAERDSVFLWDISQKQTVRELSGDPQPKLNIFQTLDGEIRSVRSTQHVKAIAFHPDSSVLAVGSIRPTAALWDVETGEIRTYLNIGETMWPKRVQFSHDGTLLAASTSSGGLKLWEVATREVKYVRGYQGTDIYDLVFTPDDQHLLMGGDEATLYLLQIETLQEESRPAVNRPPISNSGNNSRLERLTFHPDGMRFASQVNYSRIAVWDAQSFSRLQTLYGWAQMFAEAVYLPELNRIVTGIYTNVLHFWDAQTGNLLKTVEFHRSIYQLKASPDGRKIAIDVAATNQIWDVATVEPLHVFEISGFLGTFTMAFSPSGRFLASNTFRGTFVWDTETGKEVNLIKTEWADFPVLLFTRDEKQILMIPPDEEKVVFWDIETGKPIREINHPGPMVHFGDSFLQARDAQDAIEIFHTGTNTRLSRIPKLEHFPLNQHFFYRVRFHPSGNILAISYPVRSELKKHRFYDSQTGKPFAILPGRNFRFVGDGDFMFLENLNGELGLYRTSEVLNLQSTVSMEPQDKILTRWGAVKQTALLQNYPNPFNPETWIPYQLEKEGEVTIHIYNQSGALIRLLSLGTKPAGSYLSQPEAAYWDGLNNMGEPISSGLYFYSMETDDFKNMRRMSVVR